MAMPKALSRRRQRKTAARLSRIASGSSTETESSPELDANTTTQSHGEPEWTYEALLRHRHGPEGLEIEVLWAGDWPHSLVRTWEGTQNLGVRRVADYQRRQRQQMPADVFDLSPHLAPLLLRAHRHIVVFSGAGISASAGIPTFSSNSPTPAIQPQRVQRAAFTATKVDSASFSHAATALFTLCANTTPTAFHHLLLSDSVCLHLTQNVDCLESRLPALEAKTVRLHGRVDTLRCRAFPGQHCFRRGDGAVGRYGAAKADPICPRCEADRARRLRLGRRGGGMPGTLLPDIRRYGDVCDAPPPSALDAGHDGDEDVVERVLAGGIDCLVVAGTTLRIPAAERLVGRLCDAVHDNGGVAMWVNLEPPSRKTIAKKLDYMVLQSAEDFAHSAARVLRQ